MSIDTIFGQAVGLPPREREAYLDTLPVQVRSEVDALLRAGLLTELDGTSPEAPALHQYAGGAHRARVGAYRIESLLERSGRLRVYRADRADGRFDQTVALQTVSTGAAVLDAPAVEHLRRERAGLARLDHPNLARLLDGGETHDSVPYFVFALAEGLPITQWAQDQPRVRNAVRGVRDAARAIGHAHQRGVLHQALHPGVLVVQEEAGEARLTVTGFGMATLLQITAVASAPGSLLATPPAYAAPEMMRGADASSQSDVFSLGVILYEILTGRLPYPQSGAASPYAEPLPPSEVLRATGALASQHSPRSVRGDLDALCLKALHLDPYQRYETATDFADDLDRYLAYQPVEARTGSWGYRAQLFVSRHRAATLLAGTALAALLVSLGIAIGSLSNERDLLQRERAARAKAEAAVTRASEATSLLTGLFKAARPTNGEGVSLRKALDQARLQVMQTESPRLRAHLSSTLGWTYFHMGDLAQADSLLTDAVRLYASVDVSADTRAMAWAHHGRLRAELGDWDTALSAYLRADAEPGLLPDDEAAYSVLTSLPWIYRSMGRHTDAIAASYRLVDFHGAESVDRRLGNAYYELGQSLLVAGQRTEGVAWLRRAQALHAARSGPTSGAAIHAGFELGLVLIEDGSYDEAEPLVEQWIRWSTQNRGADHVHTARGYEALGALFLGREAFGPALSQYEKALAIYEATYPAAHAFTSSAHLGRARALNGLGR